MKRMHPGKSFRLLPACMLIVCWSLMALSCKHDDLLQSKPSENMRPAADFLKNNYDFTLFNAALEYTGIAATLNEKGPFTILAPDNQAWNELGIQQAKDFEGMNKDSLRTILNYHILPRRLIRADIPVNGVDVRYMTMSGLELYASFATYYPGNSYPANKLYFSGSPAYRVDEPLSNGVLHVLNKVMKPYPGKTVQNWLATHADYSIFVSGLKKFGLWDELATEGPFTIFAPSNTAFEKAGIRQSDIDALNPSEYVGGRLFGSYIFYKKRYFLSDKVVFNIINAESRFELYVRNDWSMISLMANEAGNYPSVMPFYTIMWLSPKDPKIPYDPNQIAVQVYGSYKDFVKMDHLCDNGVIHHLTGILVKPEYALIK